MKKVILALVLCLIIGAVGFAYADELESFTAIKAGFKVFINGSEFKTDKPIVTINGSTYLPLRAIGDALGTKVNWNNDLQQVEVGESTPVTTNQFSFKNPGNIGMVQTIIQKYNDETRKLSITLKEVLRGDQAYLFLKNNSSHVAEPEESYEYLLAKMNFKVLGLKKDTNYYVNYSRFNMVSGKGKEYEEKLLGMTDEWDNLYSGMKGELNLEATLYEESECDGWIIYQVKKDDSNPRIAFGRSSDGSGGAWFKAYKD